MLMTEVQPLQNYMHDFLHKDILLSNKDPTTRDAHTPQPEKTVLDAIRYRLYKKILRKGVFQDSVSYANEEKNSQERKKCMLRQNIKNSIRDVHTRRPREIVFDTIRYRS